MDQNVELSVLDIRRKLFVKARRLGMMASWVCLHRHHSIAVSDCQLLVSVKSPTLHEYLQADVLCVELEQRWVE